MKLLNLTISRVDMPLFDGPAASVTVPGLAGEMTLMADHIALISPLTAGAILIRRENGEEESIDIAGGTLEVSDNHATILV